MSKITLSLNQLKKIAEKAEEVAKQNPWNNRQVTIEMRGEKDLVHPLAFATLGAGSSDTNNYVITVAKATEYVNS